MTRRETSHALPANAEPKAMDTLRILTEISSLGALKEGQSEETIQQAFPNYVDTIKKLEAVSSEELKAFPIVAHIIAALNMAFKPLESLEESDSEFILAVEKSKGILKELRELLADSKH
jgi:tRNA isopentenyl-2-thiomethyl-A-37 hydroxylase MiaE